MLAVLAFVAWMTSALVVLDEVDAARVVYARGTLAVVHVRFAMDAAESSVPAVTFVGVDPVNADALIETRRRFAFVNVDLATGTGESRPTDARESSNSVDTSSVVLTRTGLAFVDVHVAVFARESRSTDALVAVDEIRARSVVAAGVRQTLVKLQVAIVSRETWSAVALVGTCLNKN